mmetsp:Transcript_33810/g.104385  ORF Transcript_33810/g.104385 Transcript_33810/m.104385 type:complete len:236 (-) Transcript_33810:26-733(-)|eukprot:CAMPEP_0174840020 /NCGR_PEP_ID=MMETSP1114-20130205/8418_1 /TAXON_ID=312471 /ORGANISM="Neobodo designis, Strain CCAP 1951/1" /LENGTH=235 /DNA_ID=CAMNT_0016074149 /DNA_START=111 /DNA_END=818 /DNA_ORIENTATION=+
MTHIADLHNNGRTGLHQTIDQARGAYFQLIMKEQTAADNAFRRQLASRLGIQCPACMAKVSTAKCHLCGYYPIKIPTADEAEEYFASGKRWKETGGGGDDSASNVDRMSRRSGSRAGSACGSLRSRRSTESDAAFEERVSRLESLIQREREERGEVLQQVECLKKLLEQSNIAAGGAPAQRAASGKRMLPGRGARQHAAARGAAVAVAKRDPKHPAPAHNWLPSVSGGKPPVAKR